MSCRVASDQKPDKTRLAGRRSELPSCRGERAEAWQDLRSRQKEYSLARTAEMRFNDCGMVTLAAKFYYCNPGGSAEAGGLKSTLPVCNAYLWLWASISTAG